MKFVLACYGSRGDVEPGAAVGRELLRRGHEVLMAVTPNLVGFIEKAGLTAVAYGPDLHWFMEAQRAIMTEKAPRRLRRRKSQEIVARCWREMSSALTPLTDGADLLLTGYYLEECAATVAEYRDIPLAALHLYPIRVNGHLVSTLPSPYIRASMAIAAWNVHRRMFKQVEESHRRELGLPRAAGPGPWRITKRGSLEIQAYEEVFFPGLAADWAKWKTQRPFVGVLTMELPTDADEEVASWIAQGTPPIYFGFGSLPVESPAETVAMIAAACAELRERALICAGGFSDYSEVPHFDHVKLVSEANYRAVFPACRAVVHHGGSGTTAAGLRAGVPTLILWTQRDQWYSGTQITRLKVGAFRRLSATTPGTLAEDLRTVLEPGCATRAREIATRMTEPSISVATTVDLLENFARSRSLA